jgi:predicted AlkP superfamily pyrophosphatase or phosphodiesterase
MFALHPYSIAGKTTATHGSPWAYDTNVPLLFWGAGIARGEHQDRVTPGTMAPTLAKLLHLPVPPSCEVEPLMQALAPAGTPSRRRGK